MSNRGKEPRFVIDSSGRIWEERPPQKSTRTPYLVPIPIGLVLCLVINILRQCAATDNPATYPQPRNGGIFESSSSYSAFRTGTQAYFMGQYDAAIRYFTEALATESDVAEVYNRRALVYDAKGEYDLALQDFERAMGLMANPAMVLNNRAITYAALDEPGKMMDDLNRAIELRPTLGKAYFNRGLVHYTRGDLDAAIADLSQALRYPASPLTSALGAGASPLKGRLGETADGYSWLLGTLTESEQERELAETGADEPSSYFYRALAYRAKGEYDSAIADLDEAIKILTDRQSGVTPFPSGMETVSPFATRTPGYERRPQERRVSLPSVYFLRSIVYGEMGEADRAGQDQEKALSLGLDLESRAQIAALLLAPGMWQLGGEAPAPGGGLELTPYEEEPRTPTATPAPRVWPTATPVPKSRFLELPSDVWTEIGLGEQRVVALAIDRAEPSRLYAGTDVGVFRTTDGGASWTAANAGLSDQRIAALVIDPIVLSNVYAATRYWGVCLSVDGGAHWSGCSSDVWYEGHIAGDGRIGPSGPGNGYVLSLAIHPTKASTLYAGTDGQGVFMSTDSGKTWNPAGEDWGVGLHSIYALVIDPKQPSVLYAGDRQGLLRTTNGGQSWQSIGSGVSLGEAQVLALAIDPVTTATLYAGTAARGADDCTLFKSSDGGDNWSCAGNGLGSTPVLSLAVNPQTPAILYAGTGKGVFRSVDSGETWREYNNGMTPGYVYVVAVDPVTPDIVYAAPWGGGLFVLRQRLEP